jgi:capsular exopolysaccharide synthesis family protein
MGRLADAMNKATDGSNPIVADESQSERSNVEMTVSSQVLATPSGSDMADSSPSTQSAAARIQEFDPSLAERLVVVPAISPLALEQYRRLAAALHRRQLQHRIKKILVSSALASEGKTLTAVNLALTFSESYGRNVLLIDGDMRRPTTHEVLQVPNLLGLSVGLKEEAGQKLELIQVTKHLAVLTAGEPESDPMSRLTSNRMRQVLHEASAKFDWVIIDTPPVGLLPDANLLATMADGAVLVVDAGRTPLKMVQRAVDAIGADRIMGCVLNRVNETFPSPTSDYYQYYGSRYAQRQ